MIELTTRELTRAIRVYRRGDIIISAKLSQDMGLEDGDHIQIFMQREQGFPEMFIAKGETGTIVKKRKNDRSMRLFCKRVTDKLLQGEEKGVFRIGEKIEKEGIELHSIIYKRNYAGRKEVHQV